ncbi:hypothetical protein K2173_009244 [Erythroxylum novogranatense]|uniref:Uncharacterized protein n=1 Tax=Erythroxylum novogranatense TaxID=1862640 RepID=A0AAV8S5N7_9ROSI|nr:hypothetical protein K2173_009244 [Erythroxylum novogranatense]
MNNSLCISDLSPSSSGRRDDDASDESSWTMYLEDFFANHVHDNHDSSTLNDESYSVVSDAASSVGKKSLHSEPVVESFSTDQKSCNRFSFKKRRTKEAFVDDALEDTASSPARSSKVYDLNNQFNNKKPKASMGISQEKDDASCKGQETRDLGFIGNENDTTQLKKRGLCLVPVSMVVNFLG